MKQYLRIAAFCTMLLATAIVTKAQQVRYLDEVFNDVSVQNSITYGTNYEYYTGFDTLLPLVMDVYQPVGDTATNRPIILLSHNGSFLPEFITSAGGFCFSGRKDSSIVELCKRFARRGYVAVSFDYRLGWNFQAGDAETRAKTIIQAVYRAMQDSKTLIRYFKNDFATNSNQWGIDTGKIVLGGSNSGAYVALAANSLNDVDELTQSKFVGTAGPFINQDTLGDFDGFGGLLNSDNYPGISSKFQATLALGGAIGDTSWVQAGEGPVIAFHGVNEFLTPYNTGLVVTSTLQPVIEVSGSGDFMPIYNRLNCNAALSPNNFADGPPNRENSVVTTSYEGLYPFYNAGYEPWNWYPCTLTTINPAASPARADNYIDTIMGYSAPRLYKLLIDNSYQGPVGIFEAKGDIQMSVFPNPANNNINVRVSSEQKAIATVQLIDVTGRIVSEQNNIDAHNTSVNVSEVVSGVYMLNIKLTDGTMATRRVSVEK